MSVPVGKQKTSPMSFKNTALKIHHLASKLCNEKFMLSEKEVEEHEWIVDRTREEIFKFANLIVYKVEEANSIHVTNEVELTERVLCIENAIAACNTMMKQIQLALLSFEVNENRYEHLVKLLEKEVGLLKGLRKSDRNRYKNAKK